MTDVVQEPELLQVQVPATGLVLIRSTPELGVRVLETSHVETERREIVVIEEARQGVFLVAVGSQGAVGPQGAQGVPGAASLESYVAGATVNGHRVIVTDSSGLAIHADVTNAAHANAATKVSLGAAGSGDAVSVQTTGRITEPSWGWTPGGIIYVGAAGVLTQTVPTAPAVFSKPVAVAETATRVLLIHEPPVML